MTPPTFFEGKKSGKNNMPFIAQNFAAEERERTHLWKTIKEWAILDSDSGPGHGDG